MQTMGAKAPVKDYGLHSCTKGHEPAGSGQIKDPWVHLEVYGCSMEIGLKSWVPKNTHKKIGRLQLWPIHFTLLFIMYELVIRGSGNKYGFKYCF